MYTQCPECQACFEVTAEQLKIGDGDVRCGQCLSIFNALHYLSENLPTQDDDDTAAEHAAEQPDHWHREPTMGNIDNVAIDAESPADHRPTAPNSDFDDAEVFTSQQIDSIQFPADWLNEAPDKASEDTPANGLTANDASQDSIEPPVSADTTDAVAAEFLADPIEPAIAEHAPKAESTPEPEIVATEIPLNATPLAPEPPAAREIYAEPIIESDVTAQNNAPSTDPSEADISANLPAPLLRQLQEEKAASLRPPNTPWVIGSLLMILLLLAQGSYFYRDALAQQQPELRPWLEMACGYIDRYLDCEVRRPVSHANIDILGWDVRSLPDTPQALIASTTLINNNPENQPYPLLTLSFSDINGTPLAQRRFLPREYLPGTIDIKAGMTPDTPVPVELALIDPGKQAVNFEFHTEPARLPSR